MLLALIDIEDSLLQYALQELVCGQLFTFVSYLKERKQFKNKVILLVYSRCLYYSFHVIKREIII